MGTVSNRSLRESDYLPRSVYNVLSYNYGSRLQCWSSSSTVHGYVRVRGNTAALASIGHKIPRNSVRKSATVTHGRAGIHCRSSGVYARGWSRCTTSGHHTSCGTSTASNSFGDFGFCRRLPYKGSSIGNATAGSQTNVANATARGRDNSCSTRDVPAVSSFLSPYIRARPQTAFRRRCPKYASNPSMSCAFSGSPESTPAGTSYCSNDSDARSRNKSGSPASYVGS